MNHQEMLEIEKSILNLRKLKNEVILVTGSTGLIGSELINFLQYLNLKSNFNMTLIATGRSENRLKEKFTTSSEKSENLILEEINLNNKLDDLFERYQPNYVIHAASGADPLSFTNNPVDVMTSNFIGCLNLLNASVNVRVKNFLYISSGEVYGELDSSLSPFREENIGFVDFNKVRACYPESKRATETLCRSFYKQYGQKVTIARPSHIFGSAFSKNDSRISADFFRRAQGNMKITLKTDGMQFRSYTYISDCISGLLTILIDGCANESYNVTNTSNGIKLREFAEKIAYFGNVDFEILNTKSNITNTMMNAVYSNSKLKEIGWKPIVGIDEGIVRTFKGLKGDY